MQQMFDEHLQLNFTFAILNPRMCYISQSLRTLGIMNRLEKKGVTFRRPASKTLPVCQNGF